MTEYWYALVVSKRGDKPGSQGIYAASILIQDELCLSLYICIPAVKNSEGTDKKNKHNKE